MKSIKSAIIALLIKIVGGAIVLAGIKLVFSEVGAEAYGELSVYISVITLIGAMAQFGMPQILVKNVARYKIRGSIELLSGASRYSILLTVLISLILSIILIIVLPAAEQVGMLSNSAKIFLGISAVILATSKIRMSLIRGIGHGGISEFPDLIIRPAILYLTLISIFYLYHDRSMAIIYALVLSAITGSYIGRLIYLKTYKLVIGNSKPNFIRNDWWPQILLSFIIGMSVAFREQGEILIANHYLSLSELGAYRALQQIALIIIIGSMAVNLGQAPKIAELWEADGKHEIRTHLIRGQIFSISVPILIVSILFSLDLIFGVDIFTFILGTKIQTLGDIKYLILIPGIVYILMGPSTQLLMMTNYEKLFSIISIAHCGIFLISATISVSNYGLHGLIISYAIVNSSMYIVASMLLMKATKIKPSIVYVLEALHRKLV